MRNIILYLFGLLLMQYQASALAEVLTDGMGSNADFADYTTDAGGNLHLVWHDDVVGGGAIMYKMFDSSGNILIDRTQVNTGGNAGTGPAISVDAGGLVYVVWQNRTDQEVHFMRLNPSLAPLDIVEVDVPLSAAGGSAAVHPRIRIDSNGDFHVVWEVTGGFVQYVKIDADGSELNGPPISLGGAASDADLPDVDVDTADNAHIVFGDTVGIAATEIYYAMIDGATGNVLIDTTLLSLDDGLRAGSATVNVDRFDDTLYIVFKQADINGDEEIFLARLNPALDDQNGNEADPAVLKVFETQITNGEGMFQWHVTSRIGSDNRIHATYIDFNEAACLNPYTITDAHITFAGNVVIRETLTTTGSATSCFPQARSAPGRNRIVWSDNDTTMGTLEIFASTISRADAGSSGFSCSLGNPDAVAWRAGELWLLLGLFSLLAVRRFRRSR